MYFHSFIRVCIFSWQIFQRIIQEDKKNFQTPEQNFLTGGGVESITINRKYLYQDAFDQLSKERRADIKQVVRVQMINAQGLDEAGIDGGGVFRLVLLSFLFLIIVRSFF